MASVVILECFVCLNIEFCHILEMEAKIKEAVQMKKFKELQRLKEQMENAIEVCPMRKILIQLVISVFLGFLIIDIRIIMLS